ncbi:alpha/beta fold hydrolase [Streptomyces sp. NPDC059491]|uniref:alpha/beta fold hydrolase n=1 Tax=Streptomyces sp. NPDC059491 TaxID=3346850 RepID=UPI0036B48981
MTGGATSEDRFADLPAGPRIAYRTHGPADGEPLVLVAGLGLDLTSWPDRFVDGLTGQGFHVVRFDNRDAGRSSRIAAPPPGRARQLLARPRPDAYDLSDMAADTTGLLDVLGIDRAHLVGMSMGGMIAQTLAALHPERVSTLTSIFSTTGDRRVGGPAWSTVARLIKPAPRTVEESVARHLDLVAHIGGLGFPPDEALERAWATSVWERTAGGRSGAPVARQIDAIRASGDRTAQLGRITAPTLVVHGDRDLLVHPSGGRATAAAIPGARHVEIAGMGHHLAPGVLDRLTDLVTELARTHGARVAPAPSAGEPV